MPILCSAKLQHILHKLSDCIAQPRIYSFHRLFVYMSKAHLEEVLNFIRQHRSNESNFEKLYAKLQEELTNAATDKQYTDSLQEIKAKQVVDYEQSKEKGATAWPEFENFVARFEKTVIEATKLKD